MVLNCPNCGVMTQQSKCEECRWKIKYYICQNCKDYVENPFYRINK